MNKKKSVLLAILALSHISLAFAGGILTNTNQSAHFIRMVARDASLNIDAAYTNPAGLVKLEDGFHFSFTNQSVFQTRTINSTFAGFGGTKEFEGTASAPIVPSLQAAYKKGKWVLSGNIAITGGGGKATFNQGLPSFEAGASMISGILNKIGDKLNNPNNPNPALSVKAKNYEVDQYMSGSSFIYGAQIGGSYAINDIFSVYGGFRLNIVNNRYEGYLKNLKTEITTTGIGAVIPGLSDYNGVMASPDVLLGLAMASAPEEQKKSLELLQKASRDGAYLDSKQSGWGISPIIGFNANYKGLNIGMKYEFRTALNVENKTKIDNTGQFGNGINTPHDIPALFTVGASYQITPKLLASVGYHHFFDSDADMAELVDPANPTQKIGKQNFINGGTNEYLAGLEYRVNDMFLLSAGGQITRYGVTDHYQTDLSFSINSYSIGLGGAVNVAKNIMINVGYFWTTYSDWTKKVDNYNGSGVAGTDVFSRTNKVFAAGVDFSF